MRERPFTPWLTQVFLLKSAIYAVVAVSLPGSSEAQDEARPVEVTSAKRVEGLFHEFSLTGTVTSPRRSNLSSRMEGLISEMKVDAGSEVKKGDVLVQLDTKLAELDLKLIEAEIEQAEIEMADAKRKVEEILELTKEGGFPKSQTLTRQAALSISKANLKRLQARKNHQSEKIARHQLIAPFDGIITTKISETGEWVATGTPVLELVEMKGLRFDLQMPQEFLGRVKDIDKVTVKLDAFPEKVFQANLSVVVPMKDDASRTFLTRLLLKDPDRLASPGMSGLATIETRATAGKAVQVPRDAVVRFPNGVAKVWVVKGAGAESQVASKEVRTAGGLGKMAEIVEGLEGNETIVLKGNEGLRENQKVTILPAQPTTP